MYTAVVTSFTHAARGRRAGPPRGAAHVSPTSRPGPR